MVVDAVGCCLGGVGPACCLQALDVAQPSLLDLLSHPGYMGTLLVPTDAAFDAALARYGDTLRQPSALQQVLKFHMLPPEPRTRWAGLQARSGDEGVGVGGWRG